MIGETRFLVEQSDPETCEFATAVAHAWRTVQPGYTLVERLAANTGGSNHAARGDRYQRGDDHIGKTSRVDHAQARRWAAIPPREEPERHNPMVAPRRRAIDGP